jgi:hypothetical protein
VARGFVLRRKKRLVGPDEIEVVSYILGPRPVEFEIWRPNGHYYALGELVEVEVVAKTYQGTVQLSVEDLSRDF